MMMMKTGHLEILEVALKKAAHRTGRMLLYYPGYPSLLLSLPHPWLEAAPQKILEQKKRRKKKPP